MPRIRPIVRSEGEVNGYWFDVVLPDREQVARVYAEIFPADDAYRNLSDEDVFLRALSRQVAQGSQEALPWYETFLVGLPKRFADSQEYRNRRGQDRRDRFRTAIALTAESWVREFYPSALESLGVEGQPPLSGKAGEQYRARCKELLEGIVEHYVAPTLAVERELKGEGYLVKFCEGES